MSQTLELPVAVLDFPHWRVNIRPLAYEPSTIPTLSECTRLVEKNAVRLRGWDYPHLGRDDERSYGNNWIASWASFGGHLEYWRLYQSSQFVHLFSVREATRQEWRDELQRDTECHLNHYSEINWSSVPGFLSIINTLYCVVEIVEFATRMAQANVYRGDLEFTLSIKGIKDYVLTTERNRAWMNYYACSLDMIENTWTFNTESLLGNSSERSLEILAWLFERFGWLDPPLKVIRKDIDDYKSRRT